MGAGEVYRGQSSASIASLDLCKQSCQDEPECKSITYFASSRWCSHFSTACTTTKSSNNAIAMQMSSAASSATTKSTSGKYTWSEVGPDTECDAGAGEVYRGQSSASIASLDLCKQSCQNEPECKSVTYFASSRWCSHFSTACTKTKSSNNAIAMQMSSAASSATTKSTSGKHTWSEAGPNTKRLSSLTFPVRDCHRVGRPDCTASDLTTTAPETTPPPPPGKECTPGQVCCDSNGMFATTAVQCKIQGQRDGYCNAGVCDEPKHCNGPFSSTIMLNGLCGVSSNGCKAKCKSTAGACYNTALWNMGVGLADGAYCELNGARGRCVSQSCQPITAATTTTSKAPTAKGNAPTTAPLTTTRPTSAAPTTAPLTTVRPTKGAPTT